MPLRSCNVVVIIGLLWLPRVVVGAELGRAAPGPASVDFSRDVQPILAEHCLRCHGPDKAEAGLNLADRATATKQLASGATAISPGHDDRSELIRRVTSVSDDDRMPPEEKSLKPAQIDVLRRWISSGAPYDTHWSFRPIRKPALPTVQNQQWIKNPIDAYVLARLESEKIAPAPEADLHTLIKRAALDLTGLLPTPAEVDAFVEDQQPGAYERLVDRLLESPHFGERWGRHWLDRARYADSDGYEKDRPRPDAYLYRDWVVNALNSDLPFDQFTIAQLAGDLLPYWTPATRLATAFNRQTLTNVEGGVDQEEYRVAAVFDRVDTVGSVFLGLTVGCAKCHTHKYDPITHAEYYQLFAFFNDADETTVKYPVKARDPESLAAELRPFEAELQARYRELTPAQEKWERETRARIEETPNSPLKVEPLEIDEVRAASGQSFNKQPDGSYLVAPLEPRPKDSTPSDREPATPAASDTYMLLVAQTPVELTGIRLETFADQSLPKSGPGRAESGNFVVSQLRVDIVDESGQKLANVPVQRATADFEQSGYKAVDVLTNAANKKKGWAIAPQVGKYHYLQVRTTQPLTLAPGQKLLVTIEQQYGTTHTLGRFRLRAITGDARDLALPADVVNALQMYPEKRIFETRERLFEHFMSQDDRVQQLRKQIAAVHSAHQAQLTSVRTIGVPYRQRATYRFDRGDFLSPAEEVGPGTLAVLPSLSVPANFAGESPSGRAVGRLTRLDLARWLVSDVQPLTPRVTVNQVWSQLFGAGLVRTVGDFGVRGETPSHPDLLDWLAAAYRDDFAWSLKRLLRTIMVSAVYRQSSAHRPELNARDPGNVLLARQNRLRIEGEIVRDIALQASGLLNLKIGGPSVFPPMPADLAKLSYANNFSWTESTGDDRYRRSMYTFFKRTIPHPTLMTFDCPDANVACVVRTTSNTPLQALTLLNNEEFVEAAQALVKRVLAVKIEGDKKDPVEAQGDDEQRLALAVRLCLCRPATTTELDRLDTLLDHARRYYREDPTAAEAMIGRLNGPDSPLAEAAAWVATLRVLFNLDEFITRE